MGQKVNPHGIRVGVIKDWDSRWFTSKKEFGDTLVEDYKIRRTLKKQLYAAGVPKIEIERSVDAKDGSPRLRVNIYCAKPGMVIGQKGAEIEKLRQQIEKMVGKTTNVNIVEVRNIDTNAQLVAENVAGQLERRIAFRRAMKQCIGRAMQRGAKGVKTISITEKTGRLVAIKVVTDENDLMIINKSGILIRLKVADVRVMGRATQGVRLINLTKKNDVIASVCKVMTRTEEEEDVIPETDATPEVEITPEN